MERQIHGRADGRRWWIYNRDETIAGATPSIRKLLRPKHLGRPRFFWRRSLGVLKCLGGVLGCFGGEFGRRGQTNMALWQQGIRPLWVIIGHLAYMVGRCHGILESWNQGCMVPKYHLPMFSVTQIGNLAGTRATLYSCVDLVPFVYRPRRLCRPP